MQGQGLGVQKQLDLLSISYLFECSDTFIKAGELESKCVILKIKLECTVDVRMIIV